MHGKTIDSDSNIESHYIVYEKFSNPDPSKLIFILSLAKYLQKTIRRLFRAKNFPHASIRNFANIINNKKYIIPEIVECITLPTQEIIAIKKTFWIRIIQRTWKKIFRQRCILLADTRFIIKYILGQKSSKDIPSIKGMLLKN
jgi:hypothetical protein